MELMEKQLMETFGDGCMDIIRKAKDYDTVWASEWMDVCVCFVSMCECMCEVLYFLLAYLSFFQSALFSLPAAVSFLFCSCLFLLLLCIFIYCFVCILCVCVCVFVFFVFETTVSVSAIFYPLLLLVVVLSFDLSFFSFFFFFNRLELVHSWCSTW